MYLTPDTTAILVADRHSARQLAATRHRSLRSALRRVTSARTPDPALLRVPAPRNPAGTAPCAA